MNTIFTASFGALMLAGTVALGVAPSHAYAAMPPSARVTISTPQQSAGGSEQMPVFNYGYGNARVVVSSAGQTSSRAAAPASGAADPPGDPPAAMATNPLGSGGSEAMPHFTYQNAVPVTPTVGARSLTRLDATTGVASLVNRNGGR